MREQKIKKLLQKNQLMRNNSWVKPLYRAIRAVSRFTTMRRIIYLRITQIILIKSIFRAHQITNTKGRSENRSKCQDRSHNNIRILCNRTHNQVIQTCSRIIQILCRLQSTILFNLINRWRNYWAKNPKMDMPNLFTNKNQTTDFRTRIIETR
jgi:hypothetical protein